jgi:hypothetical protein
MDYRTAKPVKTRNMRKNHQSARFVEYDNGTVYVAQPNWDNGYFSKDEARAIAAKLKKQGFQFI